MSQIKMLAEYANPLEQVRHAARKAAFKEAHFQLERLAAVNLELEPPEFRDWPGAGRSSYKPQSSSRTAGATGPKLVSARPDKEVILALREFGSQAAFITKQLPSLCIDDLVNALTFCEGRPGKAAEILRQLDQRRSHGDRAPKQRQREPYHRS